MQRLALIAAVGLFAILPGAAQDKKKSRGKNEPRIILALPLGALPGKTTRLTLRGSNLDSATAVNVLNDNGTAKILSKGKAGAPDKNPDKVGDTQIEIELKLNDKLQGPTVELVVITPTGTTKPHPVLIAPATPEKEPNDGFRTAQTIVLPATIEGAVSRPRDVDLFRFEGKKGQKLTAEVLASRYGSPLDAILTLYDANGEQVASNDDFTREHHDARIETTLPTDGTYFLGLIDAHDSGSALHVYRLDVK